ncbi:MAG: AI-2E family transporter [Oscillospiraceae bacterium]
MNNKKGKLWAFLQPLLIVMIGVVLYWGLTNYKVVEHWIVVICDIFSPCIIGFVLALILNVPLSFFERTLFRPRKDGKPRGKLFNAVRRPVSLLLTYVSCFAAIALVLWLVIPSVKNTIIQLYAQVPDFVQKVFKLATENPTLSNWIAKTELSSDMVIDKIIDTLNNSAIVTDTLSGTIGIASGMVTGFVNFIIGLVFSIYMLSQKEKLKNQLYRICNAYFPKKITEKLSHIGNLSKETFSNFISGQGLEACILGSLCAVGMKILGFPYSATIGVLVAVTAFIPIVGAFIGIGIGAFLIMITSLKQALMFVVFMIILQQIEGNLIYPKVVGQSVGLPSLWVLFAITIGGNVGGIFGMFVAVPICSVIYCLIGDSVNNRNIKKAEKEQAELNRPKDLSPPPDWISS